MKSAIWVGTLVGGSIGGLVGAWFDGSGLGVWGVVLGTVGSLGGIWAGYTFAKRYI